MTFQTENAAHRWLNDVIAVGEGSIDPDRGMLSGMVATLDGRILLRDSVSGTDPEALGQQLAARQQSVSGVDTNQELVNLLSSQQAFQLASKYISVVNVALDSLLRIL